MQAIARHDVGLVAEDVRGVLFHVHKLKETELALLVVEKQVNVGIVRGLPAHRGAEQVQMFDAEPFQLGFVLLQSAYGFVAFHRPSIANLGGCFHFFRFRHVPSRYDAGQTTVLAAVV